MTKYKLNKMASAIQRIQSTLPESMHPFANSFLFNNMVKLAGTAGIRIDELSHKKATVSLANARRVQNHIGGLQPIDRLQRQQFRVAWAGGNETDKTVHVASAIR